MKHKGLIALLAKQCIDMYWPSKILGKRHLAAAMGLAPYASNKEFVSLAFDRSFMPEYVQEAEYHSSQAFMKFQACGEPPRSTWRKQARGMETIITRFSKIGQACNLFGILKQGLSLPDLVELAHERIEDQEKENILPHCIHYAQAAYVLWDRIKSLSNLKDPPKNINIPMEMNAIISWFSKAIGQLTVYPEEAIVNELYVRSCRSIVLEESGIDNITKQKDDETIEYLIGMIRQESQDNPQRLKLLNVILSRWFECRGDELMDHSCALRYDWSTADVRNQWAQLWIKSIGALKLVGENCADHEMLSIDEEIQQLAPLQIRYLIVKAASQYPKDLKKITNGKDDQNVLIRWEEGLREIVRRWGTDNPCIAQLVCENYVIVGREYNIKM